MGTKQAKIMIECFTRQLCLGKTQQEMVDIIDFTIKELENLTNIIQGKVGREVEGTGLLNQRV